MALKRLGSITLASLTLLCVVLYGLGEVSEADEPDPPVLLVPRPVAQATARDARAQASTEESGAFADGRISRAEYEEAKVASTTCVSDRITSAAEAALGPDMLTVQIVGPKLSHDGFQADYTYRLVPAPALDQRRLTESLRALPDKIVSACQETFSDHVEVAYQASLLGDERYVGWVDRAVTSCLRDKGIEVDEGDSARDSLVRIVGSTTIEQQARFSDHPEEVDAARDCVGTYPAIAAVLAPR